MFKPNELENFSMMLDEPIKELENRIMSDVVRRIKINGEITRSADWQIHRLKELGLAKTEIKKQIQTALGYSDKQMLELYKGIVRSGYERDRNVYLKAGADITPFAENHSLQQLISAVAEQTGEELKNITQSLGFALKQPNGRLKFSPLAEYYQKTLDGAMLDISSGAFDYNTVLKRIVNEMTNSGLRSVDYATGHSNRVDVAARRAVMTGMSQLTAKVNEDNAKALDTEYFEIEYHGGARPSHWWGGRVYNKDDLVKICGLGTAEGLCGCNCYHDYYPFVPGISERSYTDEELDKMRVEENTPKDFNGKKYTKYEALQRQRRLETTMRAQRQRIRLLEEGGANEDDIITARGRYRVTSAEYTRFSKAMDLPQQRERVYVDGLGNVGVGKWKKSVDISEKSGIINAEESKTGIKEKRGQLDPGYKGKIPDEKLDEYNSKALEQIKKDTGYSDSDAEKFHKALQTYFGGDYEAVLSGNTETAQIISKGIDRMPAYDGKIYRGMTFSEYSDGSIDQFVNLKPGDIIPEKGMITSWSSNKRVAESFGSLSTQSAESSSVILECENNNVGVGVQHISKYGVREAEVLSNVRYEVVDITVVNKYDYVSKRKDLLFFSDDLDTLEAELKEQVVCIIKVKEA